MLDVQRLKTALNRFPTRAHLERHLHELFDYDGRRPHRAQTLRPPDWAFSNVLPRELTSGPAPSDSDAFHRVTELIDHLTALRLPADLTAEVRGPDDGCFRFQTTLGKFSAPRNHSIGTLELLLRDYLRSLGFPAVSPKLTGLTGQEPPPHL